MNNPNVIELSAAAMAALLDQKPAMSKATREAIQKYGAIFETSDGQQYRTAPDVNAPALPTHTAECRDLIAIPLDAHGPN